MCRTGQRSGKLLAGARLPSDAELCETHGVARMTARRTVAVLRERGLVVTEWGKGSRVVDPARAGEDEHQDDWFGSWSNSPKRRSYKARCWVSAGPSCLNTAGHRGRSPYR
ncbi:GntR family transcriptional regulator [Streptomyces sp. NPDC056773]|uniref:GntR family transcriptional regulator n=1 Tax=unclassified Streptomyces TaxID=2593676 RepID=UPI0036AEB488